MKILFVITLFMLCACNFGNKEVPSEDSSIETTNQKTVNTSEQLNETSWKGWQPPSTLNGFTLDSFIVDPYQQNGLYSALAVYKQGDIFLRFQIVDGSTDKGALEIRDYLKIATQNINSENDYGYEKTVDHHGIKAKEEYLKATGEYLIKFLYKEKYGCTIMSNTHNSETVWAFIDQLGLAELN